MWFQNYLNTSEFKCLPQKLTSDGKHLDGIGPGCPSKIDDVMAKLKSKAQGTIINVVDSVTALAHAIDQYVRKACPDGQPCFVEKIPPRDLTQEMFNVSFNNENGKEISFNSDGDPLYAYYTIENIVHNNGKCIKRRAIIDCIDCIDCN